MARNAAIKVQIDQKAITQFFTTDPEAQLGLFANAEALRETASDLTPYGRSKGQYRQRGGAGGHPVGPFGTPYGHGFAKVSYHTRKFRGGFRVYSRLVHQRHRVRLDKEPRVHAHAQGHASRAGRKGRDLPVQDDDDSSHRRRAHRGHLLT